MGGTFMKKIVTGILTLALTMASIVPAVAAETTINENTDPKTGDTTVSFHVDPTFTITIPTTVKLERQEKEGTVTYESDGTISASEGLRLKNGDQIKVALTTCDYKLSSKEKATLDYSVKVGNMAITADNNTVATFTTSTQAQTSTLHFIAGDPEYAGEYSDTVTFTIAIESNLID